MTAIDPGLPPTQVVAAIAMTHTPGLGDRMHVPPKGQIEKLLAGFAEAKSILSEARPELVVAFVNDHFDMYSLENMPTFSISVADEHFGPPEDAQAWLGMTRRSHRGNADYAMHLYRSAVVDGFDMTRSGSATFVHNILMPAKYILPDVDVPIVPIFVNCFAPPLPSFRRCYDLGRSIGRAIARRPERVALLASGGLSHWPPFAKEDGPRDDELNRRMLRIQRHGAVARREDPKVRDLIHEREAEMAASGRELINVAWDRALIDALARGDQEYFCRMNYDEVERDGGNGGHEMSMWLMILGALGNRPSRTLVYEPVKEWMGGVGVVAWDSSTRKG